jgi:hypothetical protein
MVLLPGCVCCSECSFTAPDELTMYLHVTNDGSVSVPACAGSPSPNTAFDIPGLVDGEHIATILEPTDDTYILDSRWTDVIEGGDILWTARVSLIGTAGTTAKTVYYSFMSVVPASLPFITIVWYCRPPGATPQTVNTQTVDGVRTFSGSWGRVEVPEGSAWSFGGMSFASNQQSTKYFELNDFVGSSTLFPISVFKSFNIKFCNNQWYNSVVNMRLDGFGGLFLPQTLDPNPLP